MRRLFFAVLCFGLWPLAPAVADQDVPPDPEPLRAAFFGMHFINMSQERDDADERARTQRMGERLTRLLAESGRFEFVDPSAVADVLRGRAALHSNIAHCNGCDATMARAAGADVAITGEVQKTSNLILHMTVYIRDAQTKRLVYGGSVDIRGNTDETWRRGLDYLTRHRLLVDR